MTPDAPSVAVPLAPALSETRFLHSMPDRRQISRADRMRQKLWAFRARVSLRVRGRL